MCRWLVWSWSPRDWSLGTCRGREDHLSPALGWHQPGAALPLHPWRLPGLAAMVHFRPSDPVHSSPATLTHTGSPGLSASGKSTVAAKLESMLHCQGHHTMLLDGDNVRHGLNNNLGFRCAGGGGHLAARAWKGDAPAGASRPACGTLLPSMLKAGTPARVSLPPPFTIANARVLWLRSAEDRAENIRRVGEVAKLAAESGILTITSFISPYRADRDAVRQRLGPGAPSGTARRPWDEGKLRREAVGVRAPPEGAGRGQGGARQAGPRRVGMAPSRACPIPMWAASSVHDRASHMHHPAQGISWRFSSACLWHSVRNVTPRASTARPAPARLQTSPVSERVCC